LFYNRKFTDINPPILFNHHIIYKAMIFGSNLLSSNHRFMNNYKLRYSKTLHTWIVSLGSEVLFMGTELSCIKYLSSFGNAPIINEQAASPGHNS